MKHPTRKVRATGIPKMVLQERLSLPPSVLCTRPLISRNLMTVGSACEHAFSYSAESHPHDVERRLQFALVITLYIRCHHQPLFISNHPRLVLTFTSVLRNPFDNPLVPPGLLICSSPVRHKKHKDSGRFSPRRHTICTLETTQTRGNGARYRADACQLPQD